MKPKTTESPAKEPKADQGSFWLDNAVEPGKFILVDCGYAKCKRARDNADQLLKVIGNKRDNLEIAANYRVLIRVPKRQAEVLKHFRKIVPRKEGEAGYCWTTHVFESGAEQFKLKYAAT